MCTHTRSSHVVCLSNHRFGKRENGVTSFRSSRVSVLKGTFVYGWDRLNEVKSGSIRNENLTASFASE